MKKKNPKFINYRCVKDIPFVASKGTFISIDYRSWMDKFLGRNKPPYSAFPDIVIKMYPSYFRKL